MGVVPSRTLKYTIDSVPFECNLSSLNRDFTNQEIQSDAFCQQGPITHIGNYKWGTSIGGDDDFDDGSVDDTLFAMVGDDAGVSTDLDPTGTPAAADHPHYTGTEKLASYNIVAGLNAMVTYTAKLSGHGAATRDVT